MKEYKIVNIEEIPPQQRKSQWTEALSKLPKGKAIVLSENGGSCYGAVKDFNKHNPQSKIYAYKHGSTFYVVNPIE